MARKKKTAEKVEAPVPKSAEIIQFPQRKAIEDDDPNNFFLLKETETGWQVIYRVKDKKDLVLSLIEAVNYITYEYLHEQKTTKEPAAIEPLHPDKD